MSRGFVGAAVEPARASACAGFFPTTLELHTAAMQKRRNLFFIQILNWHSMKHTEFLAILLVQRGRDAQDCLLVRHDTTACASTRVWRAFAAVITGNVIASC